MIYRKNLKNSVGLRKSNGIMHPKDADRIANSVDPDWTTSLGAVWSGSALFAQTYRSENLRSLR